MVEGGGLDEKGAGTGKYELVAAKPAGGVKHSVGSTVGVRSPLVLGGGARRWCRGGAREHLTYRGTTL